jgi:adenylosuccinate synthase
MSTGLKGSCSRGCGIRGHNAGAGFTSAIGGGWLVTEGAVAVGCVVSGASIGLASARARRAGGLLTVTVKVDVAVSALVIVDVLILVSDFVMVSTSRTDTTTDKIEVDVEYTVPKTDLVTLFRPQSQFQFSALPEKAQTYVACGQSSVGLAPQIVSLGQHPLIHGIEPSFAQHRFA